MQRTVWTSWTKTTKVSELADIWKYLSYKPLMYASKIHLRLILLIFTPFLSCRKRIACATYQLCILLIALHATRGRLLCWNKNEILDSFTSQMYVPGSLNDVENVLVDVGTGYYVEKVKVYVWNSLKAAEHSLTWVLCVSYYAECGRFKGVLQTQNWIPHKANRKNSTSTPGKACDETR